MYETAGHPETANNNLMRNANKAFEYYEWYANNLLKENLSKSQSVTLKHNGTASNIQLNFEGNNNESSHCLKLLGVTIDDQLISHL